MNDYKILDYSFNDFNYIGVPLDSSQSVTALILANVGSRYESVKEEGMAHFFEHMVFKGTKKFPNPQILASTIDSIGANFNAFTSKEYTGFYIKSLGKDLNLSLEVLSEMIMNPLFEADALERERGVVKEEMKMYYDMPQYYIADIFERKFFQNRGLGHFVLGDENVINSVQSKDFNNFLNKWYGINNFKLVLSGDSKVVNNDKTIKLIKNYFSDSKRKSTGNFKDYLVENNNHNQNIHVEYRDTKQAHFVLGWPGLKKQDKDLYALKLANVILGSNMSSRLFIELREKQGLCYYIRSEVNAYRDLGIFGASAGVNLDKVDDALKRTIQQFADLTQKKNITDKELSRAKDYMIGKMILNLDDSDSLANFFGGQKLFLGKFKNISEIVNIIKSISLNDIYQVLDRIVSKNKPNLAIIGPFKDKGRFEKILDSF
jgi:predicted Zn-dependent peptidase